MDVNMIKGFVILALWKQSWPSGSMQSERFIVEVVYQGNVIADGGSVMKVGAVLETVTVKLYVLLAPLLSTNFTEHVYEFTKVKL